MAYHANRASRQAPTAFFHSFNCGFVDACNGRQPFWNGRGLAVHDEFCLHAFPV
jgi:hypothetical protein